MVRKIPYTIEDLHRRHHGAILLECPTADCGRKRIFHLGDVYRYFRERGWDERLHKVAERFWCAECGARPREIIWVGEGFDAPAGAIWSCFAPYGIDLRAWARAAEDDRARLIRRRR
ncbi:hypothetical protein GG804_25600 [Sphingomonas histidinilytica]|uniref:hypothetical protein n=1 Tax=Rhizorhabdus histidinilytica TaxID=439228 RepID=UPI001AD9BB5E|nr:hypothetical protein [Rhizorhabdus histidinilytica]MBO9380147.1 hypothetical protein [Rhizorhabdus histidinilytica]